MILSCLSWIPTVCELICGPLIPKTPCESLPDDIITNILSRLPAECVIQCRRVCKQWKALTSTANFAEIHIKQATPTIIAHVKNQLAEETELFYIDEWGGATQKTITKFHASSLFPTQRRCPYPFDFSYNGLLLFKPEHLLILGYCAPKINPLSSYIICNPITREKLTLNVNGGLICAIFFHPSAKEYRVLWSLWKTTLCIQFKILDLGTQSASWRQLDDFSYPPRTYQKSQVILNEALHWMTAGNANPPCTHSIIIFNMITEGFSTMPHPGDECNISWKRHEYMHLLETQGCLTLCDCSVLEQIELWVLEDYANRVWVRRHKIMILELDVKRYPFQRSYPPSHIVRPFSVQNGELLLHWTSRGLFAYHLKHRTIRKVEVRGIEDIVYVDVHTKSLISLGNFDRGSYINM